MKSTGRIERSVPNLQDIPVRIAAGRRLREAFLGADGAVILSADYTEIERRIMSTLDAQQKP